MTNALLDRTAVVYIVGSTSESTLETNGLQVGIDHVALARPISKWACKVHSVDQIGRIAAQAIRVATTAPRGPVLLDVPADVLGAPAPGSTVSASPVGAAAPAALSVGAMLERVAGASRPVMLLGGAPSDAARVAFNDLLDVTGVPCFVEYGAIGVVGDDDDRYGGTLFHFGRLPEGARPDVVLTLGVRFGFDTPGLRDGGISWGTSMLQIDSDPAELAVSRLLSWHWSLIPSRRSRLWRPAVAIMRGRSIPSGELRCGDARREPLRTRCHRLRGRRSPPPLRGSPRPSDVAARHGAVIFGDGAVCKHWLHDALRLPAGSRYLTHSRLGCMGMGAGAAIGAAMAIAGRPVVCVTGDGAVGFAVGEFEAMVRHGLPICVVVMNNASWGASLFMQTRTHGPERVIGTKLSDADYHEVMAAFGGRGVRVATVEALERELDDALRSGAPTCINVSTNDVGLPPEVLQLTGP